MQNIQIDENLIAPLSGPDREIVKQLVSKVTEDNTKLGPLCEFVKARTNEKTLEHFTDLSDEVKFSACIGHLVVHMLSGKIKGRELKDLVG
jgi:hypothetical protein